MVASRRFTTLDEWLAWFETLHPKAVDFGLDRIRKVIDTLSLSRPRYRIVTVGGTNGKGSCVALLESIYRAAGYRVGAFTSPHLVRFNERVRFDGSDVSDAELVGLFERIDAALGDATLSYFESSAVAAMLHFADRDADVALLEVGMGGRLDAVNVLDADAALIVSVDLDHQAWLGEDREAIGWEKAGIMRADRPVVVADADPPASVLRRAKEIGADLRVLGRDFSVAPDAEGFAYRTPSGAAGAVERWPRPRFGGSEQLVNAAACRNVVAALQDVVPVPDAALAAGLGAASIQGRFERRVVDGVEWIFDVAHNPAAAARLEASLRELPAPARTLGVFAAMRDKALAAVLGPFVGDVERWFLAPADSERSASAEALRDVLVALDCTQLETFADVAAATSAARALSRPGDRVLVFGSFYTVGPALAALGLYSRPL